MNLVAEMDCVFCCVDARGPDGLQGATISVLLMVAWTSVIKGSLYAVYMKCSHLP